MVNAILLWDINDNEMIMKFFKKIKNIILGWYFYFRGINYEVTQERLSVCNACEFSKKISKKHSICSSCGCFIQMKIRVADERCPMYKW